MNQVDKEKEMMDEILDNFDFVKCHDVMSKIGWTWFLEPSAPSIERIKESARNRMMDAIKVCKDGESHKSSYFSSSGGLKATTWKNRYGHIEGIRLEFVLTDWDADGD